MMHEDQGYTNSQTLEAWMDSLKVFWDNTEITLPFFILLSLVAILITWFYYPTFHEGYGKKNCKENGTKKNECERISQNDENGCQFLKHSKLSETAINPNKRNSLNIAREVTRRKSSTVELSDEDKKAEEEAVNEQLDVVLKLMQKGDSLGTPSIDDLKKQAMFYYR